jgi:hypothetical protein
MTAAPRNPLTFTAVDGLAFAAERSRLSAARIFSVTALGPIMELMQLSMDGLVPPLSKSNLVSLEGMEGFSEAIRGTHDQWVSPDDGTLGFYRTSPVPPVNQTRWMEFGVAAQQAAVNAGFAKQIAHQFVGALGEMVDNIYNHSQASESGIVAYRAIPGTFEFVVSDRGIGVLNSLKSCGEYAHLTDHGDALKLTLTDGCSRHGSGTNHGRGFRPLFIGLTNLNGALRFRSGDHAITIDGHNLSQIPWRTVAKPPISGFFVSGSCLVNGSGNPTKVH